MSATGEPARRLSALSMVIDALRSLRSMPIGFAAFAGVATRGDMGAIALGAAAGIAVGTVLPWLRWRSFTYRIGEDALVIEQGLLNRSRRAIPLDRIQDVSIEQGVIARMLGLARVRIETGGGQADEGLLDSVALGEAHRLRALLRGQGGAASPPAPAEEDETVFAMPLRRVLLLGLLSFSLVWIAVLGVAFRFVDDLLRFNLRDLIEAAGRAVVAHSSLGMVLVAAALVIVLGVVASVARALVRYSGFRLGWRDGRFRCTRGLLARNETVFAARRIQAALVRRGPAMRRLGWCALEFQTLGGSDGPTGRQETAPLARPEEAARIVALAGLPAFAPARLNPVAPGHAAHLALRYAVPPATAAVLGGLLRPQLLLLMLLVAPALGLAWLQSRRNRYAADAESLQVARGGLVARDWIVPLAAVQVVTVRRSWLQRRLGLASVLVDTAGAGGRHRPDVVDVLPADAAALARSLIAAP